MKLITPTASKMQYWHRTQKHVPRDNIQQTSKSGPARKLSIREELLMTLMKLCLGVINELLSDMFVISTSSVSQIVNTYIKMLATVLRPLILWPSKQKIRDTLPKSPQKYTNLRITIDCTEVFIERPRHLNLQAQTWSD